MNAEPDIIAAGDSLCTACLFDPNIEIRNVLVKGAVWATKERCKEIVEMMQNAKVILTWIPGELNTADYASKLHANPTKLLNEQKYRKGPKEVLNINDHTNIKYYEVSKDGEKYFPLPVKLIEGARTKEKKLINLDPTRTLSNNVKEQEEVNICNACIDEDACGIYAR